jgi:hypothetical protein
MMAACTVLTTSLGLLGIVPAVFAIIVMAWRMATEKWWHGALISLTACVWLALPFILVELGAMSPMYVVRDDVVMLLPKMNHFPPVRTLVAIVLGAAGGVTAAVVYGRLYVNELRRMEHKLGFQAWQLQQLVPAER